MMRLLFTVITTRPLPSQETQYIEPMLVWCWASVTYDRAKHNKDNKMIQVECVCWHNIIDKNITIFFVISHWIIILYCSNFIAILAVKLTRIAWFSAIPPSILNRFSWNFAKAIFYSNPNSGKNFAKLYLILQKLDHLTCNKILE